MTDIEFFRNGESIEEKTEFTTNTLVYALVKSKTGNELSAEFSGSKIIFSIPQKLAMEWTETDRVGIENTISTDDGKTLYGASTTGPSIG